MRIGGKNYKSLNFTLLKDRLLDGSKKQTCRTKYVPNFEVGEKIALKYKGKFLYFVKVTKIEPKMIKEVTKEEAILDGFETIEEFQEKVMDLNKIKSKNHFCFIIQFEKTKENNLESFLNEKPYDK